MTRRAALSLLPVVFDLEPRKAPTTTPEILSFSYERDEVMNCYARFDDGSQPFLLAFLPKNHHAQRLRLERAISEMRAVLGVVATEFTQEYDQTELWEQARRRGYT